jgi:hypothetical protein
MALIACRRVIGSVNEERPLGGAPTPGGLLLCDGFNLAGRLPASVFSDGHALSARRKLDKHRTLPARNQALACAGTETVDLTPLSEREHAVIVQRGPDGHFGELVHCRKLLRNVGAVRSIRVTPGREFDFFF